MADTSLLFDIFAVDRASAVFDRVSGKGEEMGSRLGKAAKVAAGAILAIGAAAGGIAFELGKIGFEEFTKNQAAVAQLDAVLKSTGGTAGVTSAQMQKLADTIQNYSGQSHESIDASETLLLQFGNIKDTGGAMGDVLDRATAITADMAARMGGSASDNAVKLGRALSNPTAGLTALTRMGVVFTASQKAQIEAMQNSGNLMGAQNAILDALTVKYGGAAKAAGETLPGELNRAKLAFEDVAASIVAKLIPVITKLLDFVDSKVIPGLEALWSKHAPAVEASFEKLGNVITTKVMPVIVAFAEREWPKLLAGIQSGEAFITAHLVPALQQLEAMWERNRAKIELIAAKVAELVGWIAEQLVPILIKLWAVELVGAIKAFELLAHGISDVVNGIKDIINFGGKAADTLGKIGGTVGGVLSHIPHLASGGIVTKPTVVMVGESGPEAVIPISSDNGAGISPLSTASGSGGGSGGVTVQVVLPNIGVLGQALIPWSLLQKARNGTPVFG